MSLPPSCRVTTYHLSLVDEELEETGDLFHWSLEVQSRGNGKWAITPPGHWSPSRVLSDKGVWEYESSENRQDEEWLNHHRFSLEEALWTAHNELPNITINGKTIYEALEARKERT